ncbi:MAG: transcription elongation factor subunit Spt4 [Candidatus Bathyarchaeia archaeon]|jgi:DNA-directed RNA polymerase subunit E"
MRACRHCKNINEDTVCPVCKNTEFSDDYSGLLVVVDPENSILAEKLDTKEQGNYALKIR